ncbi:MAG: DUF167 domain-containing protein [Phycisphaerales bacterium]|nr:DUF167 domain-containing protein [Phycisphaerales bacterium]
MAAESRGLVVTRTDRGVEFGVKVVPGASRARVVGVLGPDLKLAVSAPPEGGRANEAVVELLAQTLGVRRGDVTIVAGLTTSRKRVAVAHVDAQRVVQALRDRA